MIVLALVVGGGCYWGCLPNARVASSHQAGAEAFAAAAEDTLPERAEPSPLPGMTCLVNEHGIRVKVIATREGVRPRDSPGGRAAAEPVRQFWPYFVFEERLDGSGRVTDYLVGPTPRAADRLGWLRAGEVERWDTRVGARLVRGPGMPRFAVYDSPEPLERLLRTGDAGSAPLAVSGDVAPIGFTPMPWPVVDSRRIEVNGQVHELVKLAFLASPNESDPAVREEGALLGNAVVQANPVATDTTKWQDAQRAIGLLEVVFVVDATGSMKPAVEAVRDALSQLEQRISVAADAGAFELRLGLIAYRDADERGGAVPAELGLALTPDRSRFHMSLGRIEFRGGGDEPEAVAEGLAAAARMGWERTPIVDALAQRVVILVGDAPDHEAVYGPPRPRNANLANVARRLAADGVRVYAIGVDSSMLSDTGRQSRREQFATMAATTGGAAFDLADAAAVAASVERLLERDTNIATFRSAVTADAATGLEADEIAARLDSTPTEVTEVLRLLDAAGLSSGSAAGSGPSALQPRFATGWALCEAPDGTEVLRREVYAAHAELDVLLASMNLLSARLDPGLGSATALTGLAARIEPAATFFEGRGGRGETLDVFLMSHGVPAARSSVLRLDAEALRHMPERERAALRERITRDLVPALVEARNDLDRWVLGRDGMRFGWIEEAALP